MRLYGHAGSDVQTAYMAKEARSRRDEANDPLLHSARLLIENGVLDRRIGVSQIYGETEERCARIAEQVITRPKLVTPAGDGEPRAAQARTCRPTNGPSGRRARRKLFGSDAKPWTARSTWRG